MGEPVGFEALAEEFPGAVDEDPEVALADAGGFENLVGGGAVDFAGEEDFGGAVGEAVEALGEHGLKD